jgi:hypothetical protein
MLPPLMPKPLKARVRFVEQSSDYERPLPPRLANGDIKQPLRVLGALRSTRAPKPRRLVPKGATSN